MAPGAENAFGGVAQAYSESVPILVIPAGYPRRLAHYYPNFNSTLNMQHITKWAEPITMGKAVPEVLRRAFFQLRNGRPGPVMLEGTLGRHERRSARQLDLCAVL
jgi:acetolactate synthase-1/2/3 large subunit